MVAHSSLSDEQATCTKVGIGPLVVFERDAFFEAPNRSVGLKEVANVEVDPDGATLRSHKDNAFVVAVANSGAVEVAYREDDFHAIEVIRFVSGPLPADASCSEPSLPTNGM